VVGVVVHRTPVAQVVQAAVEMVQPHQIQLVVLVQQIQAVVAVVLMDQEEPVHQVVQDLCVFAIPILTT
jgi:hypothetical protein